MTFFLPSDFLPTSNAPLYHKPSTISLHRQLIFCHDMTGLPAPVDTNETPSQEHALGHLHDPAWRSHPIYKPYSQWHEAPPTALDILALCPEATARKATFPVSPHMREINAIENHVSTRTSFRNWNFTLRVNCSRLEEIRSELQDIYAAHCGMMNQLPDRRYRGRSFYVAMMEGEAERQENQLLVVESIREQIILEICISSQPGFSCGA